MRAGPVHSSTRQSSTDYPRRGWRNTWRPYVLPVAKVPDPNRPTRQEALAGFVVGLAVVVVVVLGLILADWIQAR